MRDECTSIEVSSEELALKLNETLRERDQLSKVIESTGVGLWDWDVTSGSVQFNERWANIIGYSLSELSPVSINTWIDYAHPEDLEESNARLEAHWRGETNEYKFESRMRHRNGKWIWVLDTGRVVEWLEPGVPKRMIGTHIDITESHVLQEKLNNANHQLWEMSHRDRLTQLPNRRAFDLRMKETIEDAVSHTNLISVLMIDVDDFKAYNDTYGHEAGDKALQAVSRVLGNSLLRETDFVARYGGEEFVVIMQNTDDVGAIALAEKILRSVEALRIPHEGSSTSKVLSVSVGVYSTSHDFDSVVSYADRALYSAKRKGRNRFECYST